MKKGDRYLCVKDVIMSFTMVKAYTKGLVYLCEKNGSLTDDQGDSWHSWPDKEMDQYFVKVDKSNSFNSLYEKLSGY